MMSLFLMSLRLQAVLEQEVRKTMCVETIDLTPAYPEHKLPAHPPTGGKIRVSIPARIAIPP